MTEVTITVEPIEQPVTVNIDESVTNVVVSVTELVTEVSVFVGENGTVIGKNSQDTVIFTQVVGAGQTEIVDLPDETYNVYVNGIEVGSGSFPVYGNATININV